MKTLLEKILVVFIAISILAGAVAITNRIKIESSHNQVEIYIDYFEVNELARQSDHDVDWWLDYFKKLGATHVVLEEENVGLMRQALMPLRVEVGQNLLKEWNWQQFVPPVLSVYHETQGINEYDLILMTEDENIYNQISSGLKSRYHEDRYKLYPDVEGNVIVIHGTMEDAVYSPPADLTDFEGRNYYREVRLQSSQLTRLGLGFDEEKINKIKNAGLGIMPRPYSYADWGGAKYLEGYLNDLEKWGMIPSVLFFGGKQIPGYSDDSLPMLGRFMSENDIKVGLIESSFQREHLEQDGLEDLTEMLDFNAVRVFNVWPFIQERYQYYHYEGAEEIENTLYRAVTERNIRMIYFKPFKETSTVYVTDPDEYQRMFQRFERRIDNHGLALGKASVFPDSSPGLLLQMMMMIGISAAIIWLLKSLFPISDSILGGLLILCVIILISILLISPGWGEKLSAISAAILFPALSMWLFCSQTYRWMMFSQRMSYPVALKNGILLLLKMSFVSGIGAFLVAAILSDVRYLLEMDIFRGVKAGQLIPIVMFGVVFLHFFGYRRNINALKKPGIRPSEIKLLLMENIKILYIAILGFLLIAGYIYIARTGHEGSLQPTEIEMIIRNILEEKLLVRPRTKEFTVAFPALILGAYIASLKFKSLIFISGLAAIIGQTSIVNTFSHLRTPVIVSFIRTLYSLAAGTLFAALYLGLVILFVWMLEKWGPRLLQALEKE